MNLEAELARVRAEIIETKDRAQKADHEGDEDKWKILMNDLAKQRDYLEQLQKEKNLLLEKQTAGCNTIIRDNRMEKIVASLKKCNINSSSMHVAETLERLARNERNLEVGSVSTNLALYVYNNVKEAAGTETKSCISNELGMKVNGMAFDDFPFILSAHDSNGLGKLLKILRVPEGRVDLSVREKGLFSEAESSKFVHESIVPSELKGIEIDSELAHKANCRVGFYYILIMPWYSSSLNKHPSNCLDWIPHQGRRILEALKYLHNFPGGGYVHMDVKALNIFVDHNNLCYLGDFGSCKFIGAPITSCSITFCWEEVFGKPAHPKYDYFMFLLMMLIECLEDRRDYKALFYDPDARFANVSKVLGAAKARIHLETTPFQLVELLKEVLEKLKEFGFVV